MQRQPLRASLFLLLATVFWAISFPAMKSFTMVELKIQPGASTWFISSVAMTLRFLLATIAVALFTRSSLRNISRLEWEQGLAVGLFSAFGILLQMDGLSYTTGSTSAFLTQCYCILIPIIVAVRDKSWPSRTVAVGCALVLAGVAVLSQIRWTDLHLGRGEIETILASLFFTGQIMCVNATRYAPNKATPVTLIMFGISAVAIAPLCLLTAGGDIHLMPALRSGHAWGFILILTFICTLLTFTTMNFWQPHIPSTHAGLIYCAEPVFTSFFCLFLPGLFSKWAGIEYPNEVITGRLVLGGSLITAANVLLLIRQSQAPTPALDSPAKT